MIQRNTAGLGAMSGTLLNRGCGKIISSGAVRPEHPKRSIGCYHDQDFPNCQPRRLVHAFALPATTALRMLTAESRLHGYFCSCPTRSGRPRKPPTTLKAASDAPARRG